MTGGKIVNDSLLQYTENKSIREVFHVLNKVLAVLRTIRAPVATDEYDLVIGPVANDNTMPVISAYYAGIYDEEETLKRLLPQRLKDQYAFKTERAVALLTFQEVIQV